MGLTEVRRALQWSFWKFHDSGVGASMAVGFHGICKFGSVDVFNGHQARVQFLAFALIEGLETKLRPPHSRSYLQQRFYAPAEPCMYILNFCRWRWS